MLIIEDDWLVAAGLRAMLAADGFRVVGVACRADAVEALVRAHAPTLALVDVHLGRSADGIELARTVLAPAGTRVIFATARTDEAIMARLRRVDAHGVLVKPFSRSQLRAAIQFALE